MTLVETLVYYLENSSEPERGEALLRVAMMLEVNSGAPEARPHLRKEAEGIVPDEYLAIDLESHEIEALVGALLSHYRREGDPSAIWALGKAPPQTAAPVLVRLLTESRDSMSEEDIYQFLIAIGPLLTASDLWESIGPKGSEDLIRPYLINLGVHGSQRLRERAASILERM